MQRLVDEIGTAFTTDGDIDFTSIAKLPYLAAVIEESLRMYPPFVTSLARVPPAGGGTVDGHYVPEHVRLIHTGTAQSWSEKLTTCTDHRGVPPLCVISLEVEFRLS
jgi:hypothetical protein